MSVRSPVEASYDVLASMYPEAATGKAWGPSPTMPADPQATCNAGKVQNPVPSSKTRDTSRLKRGAIADASYFAITKPIGASGCQKRSLGHSCILHLEAGDVERR